MYKVKLSSIIDIISGGTPSTAREEYWLNGDIGWLSVTDFNNELRYVYTSEKKITESGLNNSSAKVLDRGDIIISARGTVGALAQIGTPMSFNQSCFGIRGKEGKVDTDFLYYSLKNYVKNIQKRSQGSVFATINLKSFDLMEIEIPKEISTQQKIANVLSVLDSKIELNNRINAELESMAKTIYDYWFVQFDFPISAEQAKAMGKPELEGKPYKSSGGKMVWNEELKREVPEGWEVKKIKEISQTGSGGTPLSSNKEYYENGDIPWINSGELNSNFIIESSKFITQAGLQNSSAKIFPRGTIIMAMYGATAGQVSLMDIEACTNQAVCAIIPKNSKLTPYLKFALHDIYKYLVNLSSGSARDNLSQDKIRDLGFAIPEKSLLEKFHVIADVNFIKIINCLRENRELSELRDWLLPMLMNGQVKVK